MLSTRNTSGRKLESENLINKLDFPQELFPMSKSFKFGGASDPAIVKLWRRAVQRELNGLMVVTVARQRKSKEWIYGKFYIKQSDNGWNSVDITVREIIIDGEKWTEAGSWSLLLEDDTPATLSFHFYAV